MVVEGLPAHGDLAVHHPRETDDVGTGAGLGDRHRRVAHEGRVVVDAAGLVEHAAVAVGGELVEAEVGHDDRLVAELITQQSQRPVEDAFGIIGL